MLVQIAGPSLERVLKAQQHVQLMGDGAEPRRRLLEALVDGQRPPLQGARVLARLLSMRDPLALHSLLDDVPLGQRRVRGVQRLADDLAHRADPFILMNERVLDLEGKGKEVFLAPHVRRGIVDHAAGRVELLRACLLQIRAQTVQGVAHEARVIDQGREPVGAQALDQALLGLQRDPALRDHVLTLGGP